MAGDHGPHPVLLPGFTGERNAGHPRMRSSNPVEERHAVHARHPDIRHDHVERLVLEDRERVTPARHEARRPRRLANAQQALDRTQEEWFVVHEQHLRHAANPWV